jgi:hypothetical protein
MLKTFSLKHLNQEKHKFKFNIKIEHLTLQSELKEDISKGLFFISYARGSKRKGNTEGVKIENGKVEWNISIDLPVSLYKDKKGKYASKKLKFKLKNVKL